ncbi:thiamine phosphate synthase [Clostridium manihotivorum]|uniref:Thiamine phosphate synthase n=1 Tax=Clostridium manihotivorum TaxID=2320868 RepID=A0A3R5U4E0_9CLOT|nr:thiamine phosphate synthase [Clostridium manihotivorum]QAA31388.1 thiamine phosphate synthase [Clostridium manihotivorum]
MKKGIYVVTNRKLIKEVALEDICKKSAEGGAAAIILREKDLKTEDLLELAYRVKNELKGRVPLIINGNYEVAKRANSDGLHLGYNAFMDFEVEFSGCLGVSIHSLQEAIDAEKKGADYLIAGHIFETSCKEGLAGRGLGFLSEICNTVRIPVIAIGGISEENINSVMKCGAYGVAVMSSVMNSKDPKSYVEALSNRIKI